jgi:hypothetical protein
MSKKTLLFAPAAFDLAETTRMLEIAKGIARHDAASTVFASQFISYGGDFEHLIEEAGFPLQRLEPRLTSEKIEHIGKVDKAEKFAPAFSKEELIQRIEGETQVPERVEAHSRDHRFFSGHSRHLPQVEDAASLGHPVYLAERFLHQGRGHDRHDQVPASKMVR